MISTNTGLAAVHRLVVSGVRSDGAGHCWLRVVRCLAAPGKADAILGGRLVQ